MFSLSKTCLNNLYYRREKIIWTFLPDFKRGGKKVVYVCMCVCACAHAHAWVGEERKGRDYFTILAKSHQEHMQSH